MTNGGPLQSILTRVYVWCDYGQKPISQKWFKALAQELSLCNISKIFLRYWWMNLWYGNLVLYNLLPGVLKSFQDRVVYFSHWTWEFNRELLDDTLWKVTRYTGVWFLCLTFPFILLGTFSFRSKKSRPLTKILAPLHRPVLDCKLSLNFWYIDRILPSPTNCHPR